MRRNGLVLANILLVLGIGAYIVHDQYAVTSASGIKSSNSIASKNTSINTPLDTLSSADIAVAIARTAHLGEAVAVANQADSFTTQLSLAPTDDKIVTKPQLVSTALKSRKDIQKYVTVDGDTVSSIATKFGITSDSVRWSNSLTSDTIASGKEIILPPKNGIVYVVKSGDTIDALASKYRANKEQIIAFNDTEISGLIAGEKIVIPDGVVPVIPVQVRANPAAVAYGFVASYNVGGGFNGYDFGYCTYYVANKRIATGRPLPTNFGNASTWKSRAAGAGFAVGSTPQPGAVAWKYPRDYYGHVAYVESVNADGSFVVSEMNVAGWNRISTQQVPASGAGSYQFIY